MRHNKKFNHLGRTKAHRDAMLSNMATSLILHKRIFTTLAKAKALRVYVEPLINRAKEDTTASRRVVFRYLQSKEAVTELFKEISGLGGHKGVRVPAIGHIHRVDMPNEHDGLSRLSAVEHRPDRGAGLLRPVLGKVAVVGLQVHGAKLLGDVICQIDFMPVDAVDPNHIVPALDDLFHSDLLLSHI